MNIRWSRFPHAHKAGMVKEEIGGGGNYPPPVVFLVGNQHDGSNTARPEEYSHQGKPEISVLLRETPRTGRPLASAIRAHETQCVPPGGDGAKHQCWRHRPENRFWRCTKPLTQHDAMTNRTYG